MTPSTKRAHQNECIDRVSGCLVAYLQCELSKAAKIREKCMVVQPNYTFSVFLAIYESS
jgi:hypothetical protein